MRNLSSPWRTDDPPALEEGARDMQREVEEGLDATKGLTDDDAARTDSVDRVQFGDFCGRYP